MARTAEARVEPRMLRWARETSGMDVVEAASRAKVKPERLTEWESGESNPSIAQLRTLGAVYHRPLAAFLLPSPPEEPPLPADLRSDHPSADLLPALRFAYRQAVERRRVALELASACGLRIPQFAVPGWSPRNREAAGRALRRRLAITREQQFSWRTPHDALRGWRSACEDAGILVSQAQRIDRSEMSGLALAGDPLPVVVLNSADHPHRRVFTLLHEVAHLADRESGLCNTSSACGASVGETTCNAIAGAALVPRDALLEIPCVRSHARGSEWDMGDLRRLSSMFRVSREVAMRRLLDLDLATREDYAAKRSAFAAEYAHAKPGPVAPAVSAVSRCGPAFARMVFGAYASDYLSLRDVCHYLGVGARHVDQATAEAFGWRAATSGGV